MIRDERAVSTPVAYTLTLSMALILVSGLLLGGSTMVDDQRERTMESQMATIGQEIAGTYEVADRMINSSAVEQDTVVLERDLPQNIMGIGYEIAVDGNPSGYDTLELRADELGASVSVNMDLQTNVETGQVPGGDVAVTYRDSTGEGLEIQNV